MSKCSKIETKARRAPNNLPARDLERLAGCYGFEFDRQAGSHRIFKHPQHPAAMLNVQPDKSGKAKAYQVRQLLKFIDEHG